MKKMIVLRLAAISGLIVFQACGVYRSEMHDYRDIFVWYPNGALEISLEGDWTVLPNGNTVRGNPYTLFVRYVDTAHMREVESLTITVRGQSTGVTIPLPTVPSQPFKPVPPRGQFGFGPDGQDKLAVPPNQ